MNGYAPRAAEDPAAAREKMNIVIVGHVDHGKSTLVGRLLADTGSLPRGKLEAVKAQCARSARPFEYAFLLDALADERAQGVTIDAARCFFKTAKRDYIIIDAPGHVEFVRNMVTGAARAEAAILLLDAHEGVRENSRRHGTLLGMLGIRQVVVAVNKMDLVGFSRERFDALEREYRAFLKEAGVEPLRFVPICALAGDFVAARGSALAWFPGPTILECLDAFAKTPPASSQPLRAPVQDVYKFTEEGDERRIVSGRVEAGAVRAGERVVFYPSLKTSVIRSVEVWNGAPREGASAGEAYGVTLAEQVFVTRGEVMAHESDPPLVTTRLRANLFWLSRRPLRRGARYKLKLATAALPVYVEDLPRVLDAVTLESRAGASEVRQHDVAEVVLRTTGPVAFDPVGGGLPATSRFVIVDGYDIAGGGVAREALVDDLEALRAETRLREFEWARGDVTRDDRERAQGHSAALVLFTGEAGVGKARIARALERRLFQDGRRVYLLDGANVLLGADRDLAARHFNPGEAVRRYGEVANLFLDAGMIVISTTNTFGLADHQAVRTLVAPAPVVTIHVAPGEAAAPPHTDLLLTGAESDDADAIDRVARLLAETGVMVA